MSYLRAARLGQKGEWYPFDVPAIQALRRLEIDPRVTFLVGENGSGKSTLLSGIALAAGYPPQGGSRNLNDWDDEPEARILARALILERNGGREPDGFYLRAESYFNVARKLEQTNGRFIMQRAYGGIPGELSHGEAFLNLASHRFRDGGLFFLDEPEAPLSPQRQLAMLSLIDELVLAGSQLIISTHSPILMSYPRSTLYWLDQDGIAKRDYQDTEHFQMTRDFCQNPGRYLQHLLQDDDQG
jgi:predicted ATPase